ncbi:hypothetical protein JCM11641_005564 [Rhodosporidiobolus odoratus]
MEEEKKKEGDQRFVQRQRREAEDTTYFQNASLISLSASSANPDPVPDPSNPRSLELLALLELLKLSNESVEALLLKPKLPRPGVLLASFQASMPSLVPR